MWSWKLSNHNCWNVTPNFIKYEYLQSWEISRNTFLLDIGLARSDLRQSSWLKVKFKEDFLNIFHFIIPFLKASFKRWITNNVKVITNIFISYLLSYSIVLFYTLLQYFFIYYFLRFEIVVGAILGKKLGSLIKKQSIDSCLQEKQEQQATCTFLWLVKLILWIRSLFLHLV